MREETDYFLPNTFGIKAKARHFVEYESVEELQAVVRCGKRAEEMLHVGAGSNLLFLSDFDGLVLHSAIRGIEADEREGGVVSLRVGAGVVWDDLVAHCVANGWHGLENLSLIPGEVGAAAVQNIGAYGVEAKDVVTAVETVDLRDGSVHVFDAPECGYGYRKSVFKGDLRGRCAVTYVHMMLSRRFAPDLEYGGVRDALRAAGVELACVSPLQLREAIIAIRRAKLPDPAVKGNAGSFFMNPVVERGVYERIRAGYPSAPCYEAGEGKVKIPAGWLIEQCGWKGRALGCAAVHDKQALVLVNLGGATGQDILRLCNAVRADVLAKFGVELRPEVNMIGGTA